jgi:L-lactate dehydrogenase (cytochrome)/(S)-mandelate dehydrogenase
MNIARAVNLEDMRKLAKRRLPKIAFDYIEGGVEDEECLDRNAQAFRRHALVPRYLVDVSKRDQRVTLFGRTYNMPLGISPTGMADLYRPGADTMLARAAVGANIPFVLSNNSRSSIEEIAKIAPDNAWMQIYGSIDTAITADMVRRARDLGLGAVVVTIDVPVNPRRERNIRNGFQRPLKLRWDTALESLTHPGWLMSYFGRGGFPVMGNWAPYAPKGATADQVAEVFKTQHPAPAHTWQTIETIRKLWTGALVVKGILHPDDAVRAAELGADGIFVSNHGGRQLDRAPSPIEALPAIHAAVGDRLTLLLDSGVRRGVDIVIARCLGARSCFFGRPTLYGVAAGGQAGAEKVATIIRTEIDAILAQIGCPSLDQLGPQYLVENVEDPGRNRA